MKLFLSLLALGALTMQAIEIAAPWSNTFNGKKRQEVIQWSTAGVTLAPEKERTVLKLDGANVKRADVIMKAVPVDPAKKYRISFDAWLQGPDTIEDNPQIEIVALDPARAAKGKPLPGWRLEFRDAAGKSVARGFATNWSVVFTGKPTRYSETFYPPPGAKTATIILGNNLNKDNVLRIDNMKFETPDEGALNVNPDFRYGKFNFSGCNYGKFMSIVPFGDKFVMDNEKGWALLDNTPVQPGKEYQFEVAMSDPGDRAGRAGLWFMDEKQKKIGELKQILRFNSPKVTTRSLRFVVPENVHYVRPSVGWGVIHSIKLTEVKK